MLTLMFSWWERGFVIKCLISLNKIISVNKVKDLNILVKTTLFSRSRNWQYWGLSYSSSMPIVLEVVKKATSRKKNKSQIAHVTSQFTSLNSALACFDVHYRNICSVCLRVSLDTALSRSHSTVHSKRMDHLVHKGLGKDMSEGQRAGC